MTNLFISERLNESQNDSECLFAALTHREFEVLKLLTKGLSNREIAAELHLTLGTIRIYLSNIYDKLEVSSRTQAVILAKENGI